jgi:toxin secretion/phage lysis holin
MKEMYLSIIAGITTASVYLLGGFDVAIQCLLIAIAIDYVSGLIKAFVTKTLSSQIGLKGILKKVAILLVVMLAVLIDRVTGESGMIRTLVIYYFVANEGLSITENLAQSGVPMPKVIKDALKALKKENTQNAKSVSSKKR